MITNDHAQPMARRIINDLPPRRVSMITSDLPQPMARQIINDPLQRRVRVRVSIITNVHFRRRASSRDTASTTGKSRPT